MVKQGNLLNLNTIFINVYLHKRFPVNFKNQNLISLNTKITSANAKALNQESTQLQLNTSLPRTKLTSIT